MQRIIAISAMIILVSAGIVFGGAIDGNESLDKKFRAGVESLDSVALGNLYVEDAVMVEQGQDEALAGRKAIQESWQGFFDGLKSIKIEEWKSKYREIGNTVIGYGYAVLLIEDKDGKLERIRVDYSDLRKADAKGTWQIIQDFAAMMPVPDVKNK
jgi:ketosteroid isomerase-like protein